MHRKSLLARRRKFTIVAACDTIAARRDALAAETGAASYRKIEDLIADPAVELVDIASRTMDHVPHALAALAAGKDVFLEKPIAPTLAAARKLPRAAARSKGNLYIRHNRRFESEYQHVLEIIASGVLGKVFEVQLRRGGYSRRDDWQTLKSCGGGQALNWGPHIIDHGLRFLGEFPTRIWGDLKRVAAAGDAEDHLKVLMTNASGMLVDIEISGGSAVTMPQTTVLGTRGGLVSDGSTITLRYLDPKNKLPRRRAKSGTPEGGFGSPDRLKWIAKTIPVRPASKAAPEDIWDHLHAAMRLGEEFPITLEQAIDVMRVVDHIKKGTPFG